jgi:WD40 repeat protein/serine/threonine protein kinase
MSEPSVSPFPVGDSLVAEVFDDFLDRCGRGEPADVEDYAGRHPEVAGVLRRVLPALQAFGDDAAAPEAPERLGDFRLLRELGRGGMGVVYQAEQISLGRTVALKVLSGGATLDPRNLQRFRTEARAAALLQHPNIVPVYAVGSEGGVHYYAMQMIGGQSLAALLGDQRPGPPTDPTANARGNREAPPTTSSPSLPAAVGLPSRPSAAPQAGWGADRPGYFRWVAGLGVQAAEALEHAHRQGVVHRDVKPSNLLLDARGRLWVADFGLARCRDADGPAMTVTGELLGTLRYMSPEQALARPGGVDHRTDVYSLGATLYELLTLRPVFDSADPHTLLRRVAGEEPLPPRRLEPAVPVDLETIVLKALAKAPEERYATAGDLADDLQRFLDHRPVRARRPTPAQRLGKWARRHRAVLLPLAAVAALALVGLLAVALAFDVVLGRQRDEARAAGARAEAEKQCTAEAREAGDRILYAAHVQLAHREWHDGQVGRALELLDGDGCPGRLRGWEWGYLHGLCAAAVTTLRGPAGRIHAVAFSPADGTLAAGAGDGVVWLWDPAGAARTFPGHADEVLALAFSADGRFLASAGREGAVKVWDVAAGREVLHLVGHDGAVEGVAFDPDGARLASAGADGVKVWVVASGTLLRTLAVPGVKFHAVAFSPDGKALASGSRDELVRLWDPVTGEVLRSCAGHGDRVSSVAFSPDGRLVASASPDETVRLWDPASGAPVRTLAGHRAGVYGVAFSPDGKTLASASLDTTVRLWDPAGGRELRTLHTHTRHVLGVAFSPDGRRLASASLDQTVRVWDLAREAGECRDLPRHPEGAVSLAFSPDGTLLASAGDDGTVGVRALPDGSPVAVLKGHGAGVRAVAFSPDGKLLASAGEDGTVRLWEAGAEVRRLDAGARSARAVAFSPDGLRLAAAGDDTLVRVWDVATGNQVYTWAGHRFAVTGLAFSPDGSQLASASMDRRVLLWDARGDGPPRTLVGKGMLLRCVAFSPDGRLVASAGTVGISVRDVSGGQEVLSLQGHAGVVTGIAFSPDGRRLASAGSDETVKVWDLSSGQELLTLKGHAAPVNAVAFSPDGGRLASAAADGTVKLWQAAPGPLRCPACPSHPPTPGG